MQREGRSVSMKEMMQRTVEILKDKVKNNLLQIQNNQSEIRKLLKEPVSAERSAALEEKYALNKILLAENNDFINVQLTLTNFFDKYSNSEVFMSKETVNAPVQFKDKKDCFDQTISNQIRYDEHHPYYQDEHFFQKLLHHYQTLEDYERCNELVREKNQQ
jgi:hypothetical protein